MAFEETIIWTALPNGVGSDPGGSPVLQLSVHVSPRLTTSGGSDTTLASFPDFGDWPGHTQSFSVTVQIVSGPGSGTYTQTSTITPDPRRSDVWQALFPSTTLVRSQHDVDTFKGVPIVSYSPLNVLDYLRQHYVDTALQSPNEHPAFSDITGWLDPLGFGDREGAARLKNALSALATERNGARANSFANADPQRDFVALREFHRPRSVARVPAAKPDLDFHQAISLAGEHPKLQRLLGLVFDLQVPVAGLPLSGTPAHAKVSVTPSFPAAGASGYKPVSPKTLALLGSSTFEAEPAGPTLNGRHLKVGDSGEFGVVQVDQDGAALKVTALADNIQLSRSGNQTQDTPERYSLPPMRSGGLAIVRVERGLRFAAALDTSDALNNAIVAASSNPSSAPDLHAEDVVRGYVLDVHDNASGSWRTVCARTGKYHFPTVASNQDVAVTEEAAVDSPPTGPADPKDPRRFHLQQSLVRWDGWSLAAPHPGLPITSHDSVTQDPPEPPAFPVDYQLHATALPRLRFGTSYAMRMRAVDLAGNAPGLGSTPAVGDPGQRVTAESRYLRFEPVPSPDIEVREDPVPGESLHRLVIRGNYDADSIENALRFVIPPRAAELLCEHHGMFDVQSTPGHTVLDKNAYNLIASRESAHYDPDQPVDPTSGVPYLPDPISRGAAVRVLDGPQANSVFSDMTFSPGGGHAWPENRPFVLRVEHGDVPLWQQDDSGRLLRVRLTKADVIRIRLSSTITRSDLDLLGQHGWVKDHLAPQGPTTGYVGDAIAGQHWLTTPYRELTLVYAVRQPLTPPALADVGPNRPTGATFSAVGGTLGFDGKSTGKLEMRARWNEPVDGGPGAPPPSGPGAPDGAGRNVEVQAFNVPIDAQLLNDHRFAERHEFGDTKHRKVAYQAIATSKFTDHFVEHATATAAQGATQQLSAIGLEPRSVTVTSPDGTTRYREDVDFTVDAGAGSVTFLKDAGPVRLTFFPPVSRSTPPLPAVVKDPYTPNVLPILDIPSSARPLAPQIAFVIPIFKWSPVTKSGSKLQSSRSPSALRVFLERPWWSSGVDELLGVVTWPGAEGPGAGTIPKEIAPFVTDWGRDPVFNSAALPSPHPRLGAFPASPAPFRATGRTLDEVAGQLVNVAGHAVAYDPARQLWYSDVQIAAGAAYTPVIRLALARYQPHSVPGVELSRVVLADFMQVAPGRAVTVTTKKGAIGSVTLSGPSYSKAAKALGGPGFARAILEMRDAAIADDVVGWVQVGSPHTMKPVRGARGGAAWVAHDIPLPSRGSFRLVVEQYEELPADARGRGPAGPGRRLVFSDVIPLKP